MAGPARDRSGRLAIDDDYEPARARTPIPEFVAEAVEIHLAKVYDQEMARGPGGFDGLVAAASMAAALRSMTRWARRSRPCSRARLPGCLPRHSPGAARRDNRYESRRISPGLDKCIASYILSQNMIWWRTDTAGRYVECLVREYANPSDRIDYDAAWPRHRPRRPRQHRRGLAAQLHSLSALERNRIDPVQLRRFGNRPARAASVWQGTHGPADRLEEASHADIGKSRYEAIAEYQREYYNRDSS